MDNNIHTTDNGNENSLTHYGIPGMHWGERNGPPYPLKPSVHNAVVSSAKDKKNARVSGGEWSEAKKKKVARDPKKLYKNAHHYTRKELEKAIDDIDMRNEVKRRIEEKKKPYKEKDLSPAKKRMARTANSLKKNIDKFTPKELEMAIELLEQRQQIHRKRMDELSRPNDRFRRVVVDKANNISNLTRHVADTTQNVSNTITNIQRVKEALSDPNSLTRSEKHRIYVEEQEIKRKEARQKAKEDAYDPFKLTKNEQHKLYVDDANYNAKKARKEAEEAAYDPKKLTKSEEHRLYVDEENYNRRKARKDAEEEAYNPKKLTKAEQHKIYVNNLEYKRNKTKKAKEAAESKAQRDKELSDQIRKVLNDYKLDPATKKRYYDELRKLRDYNDVYNRNKNNNNSNNNRNKNNNKNNNNNHRNNNRNRHNNNRRMSGTPRDKMRTRLSTYSDAMLRNMLSNPTLLSSNGLSKDQVAYMIQYELRKRKK